MTIEEAIAGVVFGYFALCALAALAAAVFR